MNVTMWSIDRVIRGGSVRVGVIVRDERGRAGFLYLPAYLESPHAMELSCSLPLTLEVFPEAWFRPYFEGLLPEGDPRRAIAERIGVREDDYLELLAALGNDCIGDVAIYEHDFEDGRDANVQDEAFRARLRAAHYRAVTLSEIAESLKDLASMARATSRQRLSLAGSQRKIGLTHAPEEPLERGWFQPLESAASTHILKVGASPRYAELELLCMRAAPKVGVVAAKTSGLWLSQPIVVSERFDREVVDGGGSKQDDAAIVPPTVHRLHQEDLNQAFGFTPGSKYTELEGGSYRAIARLLRERSISVAEDVEQLARIAVYNFLVGNCDNHLKNLSILHVGSRRIKLAPAYDILCTTIFEEAPGVPLWSRRLGMRLGGAAEIDDVEAEDFRTLADDLGIGRRAMVRICSEMGEQVVDALIEAGEQLADVSVAIPYSAEDLVIEMEPRLAVVMAVK